ALLFYLFFIFFFFLMLRHPPRSTLFSLHDALPISANGTTDPRLVPAAGAAIAVAFQGATVTVGVTCYDSTNTAVSVGGSGRRLRSEEHTSELQSRRDLVCRLLLEKKKKKKQIIMYI